MAKPRLLFYLKPESLEVYSNQSDGPARLDFPVEIVNHQEVFDQEKYTEILDNFLSQLGIVELEVVILISAQLIFSKEFPFEQSTTVEDPNKPLLDYNALNTKIEEFVDQVPFDNNQISKMELRSDSSSLVLVTNKFLYQPIVNVVEKYDGRVLSVVPMTIFGEMVQKPTLEAGDVEQIFSDKKVLQQNNFLLTQAVNVSTAKAIESDEDETDEDEDDEEKKSDRTSKFLLIFGTIFIIGGLIALAFMLGIIKNPLAKPVTVAVSNGLGVQSSASPTTNISIGSSSAVLVGSNSAALQEVKKELVKISVVNGSGVTGQGSKVKTILTNLGYKEITISGTSLSSTTDTTVDFAPNIISAARDEITQGLGKTFLNVKAEDATASATYDITITTGVYK